jgi:antitoxin component YwqK of YwqJK toxin-antitoxin module
MKTISILLFAIIVVYSTLQAQSPDKKQETYTVNLSNRDSAVKASIYYDKKEVSAKPDRYYAWYGSNKITSTQGGYEGRLLHGTYISFYPDNNLKQKGQYKKGMKNKEWLSWYENGNIREISRWKNGCRDGKQSSFDRKGNLTETAIYRSGKLNGKYVLFNEGKAETVKKYKNGTERLAKEKREKKKISARFKKLFRKKKNEPKQIDMPQKNEGAEDKNEKQKEVKLITPELKPEDKKAKEKEKKEVQSLKQKPPVKEEKKGNTEKKPTKKKEERIAKPSGTQNTPK